MRQRGKTLGICEFRRDGHSYVYDYGSLCGARHRVYPQQLLVADLIDALRGNGGQIRFVTQAAAIHLRDRPSSSSSTGTARSATSCWTATAFTGQPDRGIRAGPLRG